MRVSATNWSFSPSTTVERPNRITTTTEIADKIAAEQNLTKAQTKAIVESVFRQISEAARSGVETSIPGFGKFKVSAT